MAIGVDCLWTRCCKWQASVTEVTRSERFSRICPSRERALSITSGRAQLNRTLFEPQTSASSRVEVGGCARLCPLQHRHSPVENAWPSGLPFKSPRWHSHCYIRKSSLNMRLAALAGQRGSPALHGTGSAGCWRHCGRAATHKEQAKAPGTERFRAPFFLLSKNLIGLGRDSI
jgi:hypothetical protein